MQTVILEFGDTDDIYVASEKNEKFMAAAKKAGARWQRSNGNDPVAGFWIFNRNKTPLEKVKKLVEKAYGAVSYIENPHFVSIDEYGEDLIARGAQQYDEKHMYFLDRQKLIEFCRAHNID